MRLKDFLSGIGAEILSRFKSTTEYEYTETSTTIKDGHISVTKIKKSGDSAKVEVEKAIKEIGEESLTPFRR